MPYCRGASSCRRLATRWDDSSFLAAALAAARWATDATTAGKLLPRFRLHMREPPRQTLHARHVHLRRLRHAAQKGDV